MSELFNRRVRVVIGSPLAKDLISFSSEVTEIEDLRVQFRVERTSTKDPNTAEITITNLSEASRAKLQERGGKIALLAGYKDSLAQIFVGDIRSVDSKHEGPDWNTTIKSGDGERAIANARVNSSFKPGVKIPDVVSIVAKKMGHDISNLGAVTQASNNRALTQGYSVYGKADKELDRVLGTLGLEWSIQDGKIQILERGKATTETVVDLSADSGLVGDPVYSAPEKIGEAATISVVALLNALLRPGRAFVLSSERHRGTFVARRVTHEGDTSGGPWYTTAEAIVK